MYFAKSFLSTCLLGILLIACTQSVDPSAPQAAKNYVKLNFNGQSKTYSDAYLEEGIALGGISAGSATDYLVLSFFGTTVGTYPYKQQAGQYSGVSQVEYRIDKQAYANYKARVCPASSGYYSTQGTIKLTEYVPGKVAKGTFSGELLFQDEPDECSVKGIPFSGEFSVTN